MTNNLVSIIIVSWNGLHWLKKSLPSLSKVSYKQIEIILVDNSSDDGTIEWVKQNYPKVRCISSEGNLGFAQANNIGFTSSKGEYILFLNNDVEVMPSFVTNLVNALNENTSIAGAQSKILLLDDRTRYDTIGAFLTSTGFLYHYCFINNDNKRYDNQIDLYTPKGACMMFKRSALNSVLVDGNLFDPDAFAYFEETDMAHRIWLSGKRIIYVPSSVIYHKMGGTSTKMNSAFIQYHSFKNRIACYIKNLEWGNLIKILSVHLLCCEVFALLYLLKGQLSVTWAIQKAFFWNIFHIGQTLKKRAFIQSNIRTVDDSVFFKKIFKNAPLGFYIAQSRGVPYLEN